MTHLVSSCLAQLVAFIFGTELVTHSGLIGLSELVAELLTHLMFSSTVGYNFYDTLSFNLPGWADGTLGGSFFKTHSTKCWGSSTYGLCVCVHVHFEGCDWSTRFMRVISLGLSSVNGSSVQTGKCVIVKVVYKSVHVCYSCLNAWLIWFGLEIK